MLFRSPEGTVIELSWYGTREIQLALGGSFHSGRLSIRGSQVGKVARPGRDFHERLALALDLLRDPVFDALITGESPFDELPEVLAQLASGERDALLHVINHGGK